MRIVEFIQNESSESALMDAQIRLPGKNFIGVVSRMKISIESCVTFLRNQRQGEDRWIMSEIFDAGSMVLPLTTTESRPFIRA
jgi:hypothetical protein